MEESGEMADGKELNEDDIFYIFQRLSLENDGENYISLQSSELREAGIKDLNDYWCTREGMATAFLSSKAGEKENCCIFPRFLPSR